jgi:hypothetical protein
MAKQRMLNQILHQTRVLCPGLPLRHKASSGSVHDSFF